MSSSLTGPIDRIKIFVFTMVGMPEKASAESADERDESVCLTFYIDFKNILKRLPSIFSVLSLRKAIFNLLINHGTRIEESF